MTGKLRDVAEILRDEGPAGFERLIAGATPMTPPGLVEAQRPPALPPYPLEVLPPLTRRCVEAFAAATQAPVELAALPALAGAAAAAGPCWRVGPGHFHRAPNVWAAVVSYSGTGKSPTARETRRPLLAADIRLREEWEHEHQAWRDRAAAAKGRRGGGEDPGPEPQRRPLIVTDVTPEALASDLAKSAGHGLLLHSDELASMLEGMDAYGAAGSRKGRKFYLSVWSEEEVRVSRRSSPSVEVDRPFLTVFGGVQHAVLSELELRNADGLCARFLWAVAPSKPHGLGEEIPDRERQAWNGIVRTLLAAGEGEPQALDRAGLELLDRHLWESTARAGELEEAGLGLLAAMHGKASDYLVRLAALLHGLDQAEEALELGGGIRRRPVPVSTIERAAVLVDYHLAHGRRVVELVLRPREEGGGEGRAMTEAEEVATALAAIVPLGARLACEPLEWARRLEAAGCPVEGKGDHGKAIRAGVILKRLAACPVTPVAVRELARGGGRDGGGRRWEIAHGEARS